MVLFEQDLENHINLKALQSDEGIMPNKDDSNNNNDISSDIEFYMVASVIQSIAPITESVKC